MGQKKRNLKRNFLNTFTGGRYSKYKKYDKKVEEKKQSKFSLYEIFLTKKILWANAQNFILWLARKI